jgi:hypothetical protein
LPGSIDSPPPLTGSADQPIEQTGIITTRQGKDRLFQSKICKLLNQFDFLVRYWSEADIAHGEW